MKHLNIFILFFLSVFASRSYGQGADPYASGVSLNPNTPQPIGVANSTNVIFSVGNGGSSFQNIPANAVTWTLDFPINILTVGAANFTGTPFVEISRTVSGTDLVVIVQNNTPIPPSTDYTFSYAVTGTVANSSKTVSVNAARNACCFAIGNLDASNDNASSPISFQTVLQVSQLSFTAVKAGSSALLNWQTATELNSKYFDVQWSKDAATWQSIGNVAAAGNSSVQKSYSLVQNTPVAGVNYYRLKAVDAFGNFVYSAVRVVNFSNVTGIKIFPNPVINGSVYITSNNTLALPLVVLLSPDGKQLQQNLKFISGSAINMSNYPAGMYLIKVTDTDGTTTVKSVIKE